MLTVKAHVKANFMPESTQDGTTGGEPVSQTKQHREQEEEDAEPERSGGRGTRTVQIKKEDFEQKSPECSRAPCGIGKVKREQQMPE